MKNLFYLCLVAILSLGSTGFTTVEEKGNTSNAGGSREECGEKAAVVYNLVKAVPQLGGRTAASAAADAVYEDCRGK